MAKHTLSQVAQQFSRYLDSYAKRAAPGLTDEQAQAVDDDGDRIIRALARTPSRGPDDVFLKMRAALQEGAECAQAAWLFASIKRDIKDLSVA